MFTMGELLVIELLIQDATKTLDLSTQIGQEVVKIIGICEREISKLRTAALAATPPLLREDPEKKD